eukprot:gene16507-biopygen27206
MSLPAEPPPPSRRREHETLIQYNLRNKVCAYCKRPGARLKCEGCRQRSYCDRGCQKRDWKQGHRGQCVKLQQVFVPPLPGWRGAAAEAGGGSGGGGAAAAGGGSAPTVVIDEDDEIENPCPICLDNEDDATVDGNDAGMCSACGQSYCGACNEGEGRLAGRSPNCPTCRAPFRVTDEEEFKRLWKLEHDRSPGRHTPTAQNNLGIMYRNGEGVEQDHVEAVTWYRKSAEAGDETAQYNLGNMYHDGKGVEQDHVEAATWFRKSAEAGNAMAQYNLGIMYRNGEGVEQDDVEAAKWYRKAAEAGITMAHQVVPKVGKSAEAGYAPAQNNLGFAYDKGNGVEQDHVEAAKWYRKSAEAGNANAQCNLGFAYRIGEGVEQDHVEAATWFRKSAEAGDAPAQRNLGVMYRIGEGVEQDQVEAATWFRKSAEAGHEMAQYNLGVMYRDGEGVEQDHVEAAKWFRKSAEAGYAMAQNNLSAMYGVGKGVEQDLSKALKWVQLAAAQGFEDALKCLNHLQQANVISTPPPGTAVTTILLTSANAAKYNTRTGRVVEPAEGVAIKPGRAAVLLDSEAAPISFKLMNVRVHP